MSDIRSYEGPDPKSLSDTDLAAHIQREFRVRDWWPGMDSYDSARGETVPHPLIREAAKRLRDAASNARTLQDPSMKGTATMSITTTGTFDVLRIPYSPSDELSPSNVSVTGADAVVVSRTALERLVYERNEFHRRTRDFINAQTRLGDPVRQPDNGATT